MITLVAPTPPPYAGPEISTAHILSSPLAQEFSLIHVRSNLKASSSEKGAFSLAATAKQLLIYFRIARSRLLGSRGLYVLVAFNLLGFLKDAGSIWLGRLLGMRVLGHLKGATLPTFYRQSRPWLQWLIRATLGQLEVMIVQASSIRDEIASTFGLEKSRLPIVPNMVENGSFCENDREGSRLLYIGHLSVGKGFVDLVSVFQDILADFPDAVLRCAGEPKTSERDYVAHLAGVEFPPDRDRVIQRVVEGDFPQTEYLGLVKGAEKEDLLCSSDILILPSYSESFPMVVLEAMSHGCAVIATSVGALPEMIADGSEGLLVPPGDRPALATAIRTLLSDQDLRRRLTLSARAKVKAAYSVEKVVPLYSAVFNRLVGEGSDQ